MQTLFQKGKFYSLPIDQIVDDGENTYFRVTANGKYFLVRMFDFQKLDPEVTGLSELPCLVKDIHGDNIEFVQNFARMFGKDYSEDKNYQFVVVSKGLTMADGCTFYNVRDLRGVPFKLKMNSGVCLMPNQKIYCKVNRPSPDRLFPEYVHESKRHADSLVTPEELLKKCGTDPVVARWFIRMFNHLDIFSQARTLLAEKDNEWIINAILAVPVYWESNPRHPKDTKILVEEYIRICLYIIEESEILRSFPESERRDFQESLIKRIRSEEIYSDVLDMMESGSLSKEVDSILHKIRSLGFIYRPDYKISLLIAIFSIRPSLLEQHIDTVLDIIKETNGGRRSLEFKRAFCWFMTYYIENNREAAGRRALVNDEESNRLVNRMIRALSYLLLMSDDEALDRPLYRSLLLHFLSYVRYNANKVINQRSIVPSDILADRAFQALLDSGSALPNFSWLTDVTHTEVFAHRMAAQFNSGTGDFLATKSFESETARLSVNNGSIMLSPNFSKSSYKNVVLPGLIDWYNIQIYLPNPSKYCISRKSTLTKWKDWWSRVEQSLFTKETKEVKLPPRKLIPDVKQKVMIRVVGQDKDNPQRFRCRIEDDSYYGEGYLDVYGKGATIGLFHYDPSFDIDSFYYEGEPLLIEARINAVKNSDTDKPVFMFDAMGLMDNFVKENVNHGTETDCKIIYHDIVHEIMLAISDDGYGVFVPDRSEEIEYDEGDCVKVMITDNSRPNRLQGEVIGHADTEVDVKEAAENLLLGYCDERTFQLSEDQLEEDSMSLSDDQFEPAHISQLIAILDHKALTEENKVSAYGYLSVAKILAKMMGDEEAVKYLDMRQHIILILDNFGKNDKVDAEEFESLSADNKDLISAYPLIEEKLSQIQIVGSLGRQERNEFLWNLASKYSSAQLTGKLARLMLSYNLSDSMELNEHRLDIVERIKQLLNIKISVPVVYSFGEESQRKEFKSSVVFPPDNHMKPNKELQTYNILKVIAGMANAYGGKLYLGVFDIGTAKGLDDDLALFNFSQDKYKLYVRNQIREAMGAGFNASIVEEFPEAGDKWIYVLAIRPSKSPVGVFYGGRTQYFLREGTSTYEYPDVEELEQVMKKRDFAAYGLSGDEAEEFQKEFEDRL